MRADVWISVNARAMFSRMVSASNMLEPWKMKPSSSRRKRAASLGESPEVSLPFTKIHPEVGASMVAKQFSNVDFPDPLGPMMATNSPASTEKLTFSSACVALSSCLRRFDAPP